MPDDDTDSLPPRADLPGHEVTNQPGDPGDEDLWAGDPVLRDHSRGADAAGLAAYGRAAGQADMRAAARDAERHAPELVAFDAGGRRLDEVAFHPAYHRLMKLGLEAGYAGAAWTGGSHVTHAGLVYLHSQFEPGTCCPMTMTYAAVPALGADADLAALWRPKLTARAYDPAVRPVAEKAAATLGMAMTEKQGGSDLRGTSTRAEPAEGGAWARLTGHKWFCSAPMSDGFLTLAQAPGGLTCYLVPRWLPEGRNTIHLMRLKDKLGNRANASAEIEYHGALAQRLGDEGRGVATIIEMVHHTRLDTAMAPAGLMRAGVSAALRWARGRTAFQRRLIDQPLMRQVLADLALDAEGATALGFRVARAFDDPARRPFARLAVALAKFLNNKLCPPVVVEAMEALGGMGYVEETGLPMLYREAPLNGIWEGSGNVICLDILRTLDRLADARDQLLADLEAPRGRIAAYDRAFEALATDLRRPMAEGDARALATRAARLLTAAALIEDAPLAIAQAYAATRLPDGRAIFGASALDPTPILARLGGAAGQGAKPQAPPTV